MLTPNSFMVLCHLEEYQTQLSLSVNGSQIEGVAHIKSTIFNHFDNHFCDANLDRPSVENLTFKTLNREIGVVLTKLFCVEEVKQAFWDCDSFKSLGVDEINFGFIKKFWIELKYENLSKGINNTIITLIPKVESP